MEPTVTNPPASNPPTANPDELRRQGRHGEAVAAYRQALAAEPGNPRLLIQLGLTLHDLRRFDEAVEALRQAVALAPVFAAHYNLAVVLAEQLRFEEAIQSYRAALAIEPHPYALINLGLLLRNLGRHAEAVDYLKQAAALAPDLPQAHLNLAAALLASESAAGANAGEAIAAVNKVLALAPNAAEAHAMLAQALVHTGDLAGAADACRRSLSLDPTQMGPRAYLMVLLQALGRLDDAQGLIDYGRAITGERFTPPSDWPSLAAFNQELADCIRRDSTLRGDRPTATQGGAQTLEILDRPDRAIVAVRKFFEQAVARYIATVLPQVAAPIPIPPPAQWRLGGWGVVLKSAGYQIPHFHPSGVVSGVYYVKIPPEMQAAKAGTAGHITFGSPPQDTLKMMSGPTGREAFLRTATIKPDEGLLILFPSYLWHHTIPFQGTEDRISLAFDVNPVL